MKLEWMEDRVLGTWKLTAIGDRGIHARIFESGHQDRPFEAVWPDRRSLHRTVKEAKSAIKASASHAHRTA